MVRRNDNARPRIVVLDPDGVTEPGNMLSVDALEVPTVPPGRDHGSRAAAKSAPSRITGRMYSQVHEIADVLDAAEVHLGRLNVPDPARQALADKLTAHRGELAAVRAGIPTAPTDSAAADDVKAALARLESSARLLEPAATALTYARRDLAALKLDDGSVPAAVTEVEAASTDVLICLAADAPGKLSAAVARLRSARGGLAELAAARA